MFLPKSLAVLECKSATHKVFSNHEELLRELLICSKQLFSGYLTLAVPGNQTQVWNLYFLNGKLVGSQNGVHPVRCWYRQIARYCPQLSPEFLPQLVNSSPLWDYSFLTQQVQQGQLSQSQMMAVVRGNLIEILFDFIQTYQSSDRALGLQLTYHDFCQRVATLPTVLVQPAHVLRQAMQIWNAWNRVGLGKYSPNLAPVIQNVEALRQQTSSFVFENLTQLIDGNHTLYDLAIKRKQHVLLLTRSIMPYVTQGIMGLTAVPDIVLPSRLVQTNQAQPILHEPIRPLIAYLEDSQFDNKAMEQILRQAGYRFTSIDDPVQALPWLLEQKPDLIFLDVLMPVLSGHEVCILIRQISTFKNTPIIILSSRDGIFERTRAKIVGASDFLAKPITSEKVLAILQNYLPIPSLLSLRMQLTSQNVYAKTQA
ncbi:MAG: PleD family two-component system response regulator [Leptolyngbyaceae cyanobacterium]